MNISDEAVEAVLKALAEHVDASECCVRAALEAAAPFISAEAWHRGYVAALDSAAKESRIRGDVGKEDEGGITAWDFLAWRARQASGSAGAGE